MPMLTKRRLKAIGATLTLLALITGTAIAFFAYKTAKDSLSIQRQSEANNAEEQRKAEEERQKAEEERRKMAEDAKLSEGTFTHPSQLKDLTCPLQVERSGVRVRGTATLRHDDSLWLLIGPSREPKFYIPHGEAINVANGRWTTTTKGLGAIGDQDSKFNLYLVAADYNNSVKLLAGFQSTGYVEELPNRVIARACLTRT